MFSHLSLSTLTLYYNLSLFIGLPLGSLLMFFWALKVYKPLVKNLEESGIHGVGMKTLFYMFPGLLAMIICVIPVIYFSHLYSQRDYCIGVINFNKGIQKDDEIFEERCSAFDIDELFEHASETANQ